MRSKELQKKNFDMATDFGNKWVMKDPKEYKKLQNELDELMTKQRDDLNAPDDGDNMYDATRGVLDKFITEKNIHMNDMFSLSEHNIENAKKLQKEFDAYQDNYLDKNYPGLRERVAKRKAISLEQDDKIEILKNKLEENIDPEFKKKVINIYKESDGIKPDATLEDFSSFKHGRINVNKEPELVYGNTDDLSFKNLSDSDQEYVSENWNNIGGVRSGNSTITLGSRPAGTEYVVQSSVPLPTKRFEFAKPDTWKNAFSKKIDMSRIDPTKTEIVEVAHQKMIDPDTIAGVNAHEIGHDHQDLYSDWTRQLQEYNDDYEYYTGHDKNKLAKEFKDALVAPTKPVNGRFTNETWKSGVGEVHSELMKARFKTAKHYVDNDGLSLEDAIHYVKSLEAKGDDALYDFYLKEGNLDKHFKRKASKETKKAILKALPVAIPAIGTAAAVAAGSNSPSATNIQEQKYGGSVEDLFKFFR
jgi:hypothetical protein